MLHNLAYRVQRIDIAARDMMESLRDASLDNRRGGNSSLFWNTASTGRRAPHCPQFKNFPIKAPQRITLKQKSRCDSLVRWVVRRTKVSNCDENLVPALYGGRLPQGQGTSHEHKLHKSYNLTHARHMVK